MRAKRPQRGSPRSYDVRMSTPPPRPWRLSPADRSLLQLLEHLVTHSDASPVSAEGSGLPNETLVRVQSDALRRGLLTDDEQALSAPLALTSGGEAWLSEIRARRDDRQHRRAACRTEVLHYLDRVDDDRFVSLPAILADPDATYYGQALTETDLRAAGDYLAGEGLLTGTTYADGTYVLARLTSTGRRCVEDHNGDVVSFRRPSGRPGPSLVQNIHTQGGAYTGQTNLGDNVDMTQVTAVVAGGDVQALLDQLRHLIDGEAGLEPDVRQDLDLAVEDLEREVSDQDGPPDPQRVRRRSERIRDLILTAGVSAATSDGVSAILERLPELLPPM